MKDKRGGPNFLSCLLPAGVASFWRDQKCRRIVLALVVAALAAAPRARAGNDERTNLQVVVNDSESGQPIYQAHLTLTFREHGSVKKLKRPKTYSYSAKTNAQGRYRFTNLPKGSIHLIVTADRHQALGRDYELDQDSQVIEIKLKKPQPLL